MTIATSGKMIILSGSSNPSLVDEICDYLGIAPGKLRISRFSNGEIYVKFQESVRGTDAFVVQTISAPVNDHLMELLIMIDALKRASAERITAVIPHYGYARQDKKTTAREPITAKLVADLLSVAGIDRLLTMDLHAGSIQGFFDVPVDHLSAFPLFTEYFEKKVSNDLVIVAPDVGRAKTAAKLANRLKKPVVFLYKTRPSHNEVEVTRVVGEVKGKVAVLIDDMIDTAGTMVAGARALKESGASAVYACATHPVLSPPAIEKLEDSLIKELITTNTLPLKKGKKDKKIKILSIAPLFAQTIKNIHENESVSQLFEGEEFI